MSWETTDVLSADTTNVLSTDTTDVFSADITNGSSTPCSGGVWSGDPFKNLEGLGSEVVILLRIWKLQGPEW